jgi:imidazolonepropionase-like amidohydrolase
MKRASLPCLLLLSLASADRALAQRIETLGPAVRRYVSVGTPRVILEHVEVIDGTGAAPVPDRNVTIEGGKIRAISAGADVAASDGTSVLDLKGYSVMPGIVGMHNHLFCFVRENLAHPRLRGSARNRAAGRGRLHAGSGHPDRDPERGDLPGA